MLDKADWSKHMKGIAAHPELISPQLAEAGYSERELQKFMMLEVLPFRLETVLDSISGLRADEGLADAEANVEMSGVSGSIGEANAAAAAVAVNDKATAVAEAEAGVEGNTLLIVLYQQDDSQRAQYYTLPL